MKCCNAKNITMFISILLFAGSINCIILFILFGEEKNHVFFKNLGEIATYLLLLSILGCIIKSNIQEEEIRNKITRITPTII